MITDEIAASVRAVQQGQLIIYPTDTLYALGADVFNANAVKKVFEVKQRPYNQPLPVAVSSVEQMKTVAHVTPEVKRVARCLLPGPLTLILEVCSPDLAMVTGEEKTIAVRIPSNPLSLSLLNQAGPLTVTSANIHGKATPSTIASIHNQLGSHHIAQSINVGCLQGKPSTIVDLTQSSPRILRKGVITKEQIQDAIVDE